MCHNNFTLPAKNNFNNGCRYERCISQSHHTYAHPPTAVAPLQNCNNEHSYGHDSRTGSVDPARLEAVVRSSPDVPTHNAPNPKP